MGTISRPFFNKTTTMSDFEATKRRRELRRQGLCITCATAKATPNKDGNMGLRCDPCGKVYSGQSGSIKKSRSESPKTSAANVVKKPTGRPSVFYDADDEKGGYVEPAWRVRYREQIRRLMLKLNRPICTRDVHEAFGYQYREHTVATIKSIDNIEEYGAEPVKYRFRPEPRRIPIPDMPYGKPRPWDRFNGKPQQPYNESQFRGRNVTA